MRNVLAAWVLGICGGLCVAGSVASAQCSAWANTMAIANELNNEGFIIDETLGNNAQFIVVADSSLGVVAICVDDDGGNYMTSWSEDENGTAILTDGDLAAIFSCNDEGGIYVTISGPGLVPETFAVSAAGEVTDSYKSITSKPCATGTCKSCGVDCDGTWREVAQCASNRQCCGYAKCISGGVSGTNMCCITGDTCKNTPPAAVQCVANSSQ